MEKRDQHAVSRAPVQLACRGLSLTSRAAPCYFFAVSLRTLGQWLAIVIVLTLLFGEMIRVRRKQARRQAATSPISAPASPPARP